MAADDIRAAMANVAGLIADGILHAGWRDDLGVILRIAEAAVAETEVHDEWMACRPDDETRLSREVGRAITARRAACRAVLDTHPAP